jgi:hypothetical protein
MQGRKEPFAKWRRPVVNIPAKGRELSGGMGTMSSGRSEKRMLKSVRVEVCLLDDPTLKERTLTENVSGHGVRVLAKQKFPLKQQALVTCPSAGVWSRGKVVYCQRVAENRFALGLELSDRVELWAKPY